MRKVGMQREIAQQLKAVLSGDREAASWLFDAFAPRLYRRLKQRYAFPGGLDVDDLLQEAFLFYFQHDGRVLRRFLERTPEEFQTATRLEGYLWDLACGVASNQRRKASKSKNVVSLPEERVIPFPSAAERNTISKDLLNKMEECLAGGRERIFLYYSLRYRDGLTPEQISQTCGWSRKATYKLKQALDEAVHLCARTLGISVE